MILVFFDKLEITDYERSYYDLDYPLKPGERAYFKINNQLLLYFCNQIKSIMLPSLS